MNSILFFTKGLPNEYNQQNGFVPLQENYNQPIQPIQPIQPQYNQESSYSNGQPPISPTNQQYFYDNYPDQQNYENPNQGYYENENPNQGYYENWPNQNFGENEGVLVPICDDASCCQNCKNILDLNRGLCINDECYCDSSSEDIDVDDDDDFDDDDEYDYDDDHHHEEEEEKPPVQEWNYENQKGKECFIH